MNEPAIGIDLGTTNSAVATLVGDKPRIIERRDVPARLLPSMVGFTPNGDRVVGEKARFLAETHPENVAYAVKRFVGQRWSPELANAARAYLPYPLVAGPAQDVRVKVAGRTLPAVQVQAMILSELRLDAEAYFGRDVRRAVITVPANFNDAQRQATKEAAAIAGLDVLRLVNEPTAAALAYGLSSSFQGRALVFDLGGGTFDVSVLEVREGVFEVVATGGDPFLGGEDFDLAIVQWLLAQLDDRQRDRVQKDKLSMQRLKVVAEQAKKTVSGLDEAQITVELLPGGDPFTLTTALTRDFFEQIVQEPARKCLEIVDKTLTDAKLDPSSMNAVLLVGGMTRVPLIRRLVSSHFGKEPATGVDPDEVVALGAAVHAAEVSAKAGRTLLMDVVSSPLGVGVAGGLFKQLIPKNKSLPVAAREVFHPSRDGQTVVRIPVYQGESTRAPENFFLGELTLEGLRKAARSEIAIEVSFELGTDGILAVHAVDVASGKAESARILARTDLSEGERERMAADEAKHRKQAVAVRQESEEQLAMQREEAARQRLTQAMEKMKRLHKQLAIAAEEVKTEEARAVVENIEQQLVVAMGAHRAGSLEKIEHTATELEALYAKLTAAA